ncbi:unnamed protein product [Urochloa humidicola]
MAPLPPPAEILLHLPPGQPEHLFHAALVCKTWLRILYDPAFRRRYRVFRGAPPLLGCLLLPCARRRPASSPRPRRRPASAPFPDVGFLRPAHLSPAPAGEPVHSTLPASPAPFL